MTAFQPRPVYSFIWKTPPSSLEFHCPTMAQLKAEIIKLFVFFPRFSILSKIFKRLAFANHSLSTSLDFLFEQVRPSSAKRFTSNWTWTNEDYEEFWGRTVAELLFMKERVKKSCIEKWLRSIDPPPPDTNTLLEKLFELSHSKHTARNCLEDTCWWRLSIRV